MLHVFLLRVPCFVGFFGKKCRKSVLLMIVYIDQDRKLNVEDGANTCLRQSGNVHLCTICNEILHSWPQSLKSGLNYPLMYRLIHN